MSRADRRPPFLLGEKEIGGGSVQTVELQIARLPSGTWSKMPVVVIHGSRPGPTLWLSGAVHGDELNGVEVVRKTVRMVDPGMLAGTILAVPIVNVFGLSAGSRYLPDGRDLNRCFPGSARGSLAAQLAHIFFWQVVARCDYGIDFHTGAGGRCNLPQLRCDIDDRKTRALARAFGPPLILQAPLRDGSLRARAVEAGARVLVYEAGEALRFDDEAIRLGIDGTMRVLGAVGMLPLTSRAREGRALVSRKSRWMRSTRSGFCHLRTRLGARLSAGDPVAVITDSLTAKEVPVTSRTGGLVVGLLRSAVVHRGDAIANVAEVAR